MDREYRINHQIRVDKVNLILPDGTAEGVVLLSDAIDMAEDEGMDLVEVSNKDGEPPVCKILDYGKMKYQQTKKKKNQKQIQHQKEIKCSFNISDHDLAVKHKKIFKFLKKRYIVKYVLELKGRERQMRDEALKKMESHLQEFEGVATWKPVQVLNSRKTDISTILRPI